MPIYTKKGDKGETSLFDPKAKKPVRLSKDSLRVEAIGAVDELNSYLGVAKAHLDQSKLIKIIFALQKDLFASASILAGSSLPFAASKTTKLERAIDKWSEQLPPVKNFVIAGGCRAGSLVFYARTLARRAERRAVALNRLEKVRPNVLKFLNRLSDYLWMFSRYINHQAGHKEEFWQGKKK